MRLVPCALSFVYHFISYNCPTFIYLRASTLVSLPLRLFLLHLLPPFLPALLRLHNPVINGFSVICGPFTCSTAISNISSMSTPLMLPPLPLPPPMTWRLCDTRRETNVEHVEVWQTKCESAHMFVPCLVTVCLPASPYLNSPFPTTPTWCPSSFTSWSGGWDQRGGHWGVWERPDSVNCHINCRLSCSLSLSLSPSHSLRLGNLLMSFSVTPLLIRPVRHSLTCTDWQVPWTLAKPKSHCTDLGTMHKAGDAGLKNSVALKLCSIVGVSFKASRERMKERDFATSLCALKTHWKATTIAA